jgi:diphosphate-dependent phosphofructokinase
VIRKALVDLKGTPFQVLQRKRQDWMLNDVYSAPGPVQFHGERHQHIF